MFGHQSQGYGPHVNEPSAQGSSVADALVPYGPSSGESTPLLSGKTQRNRTILLKFVIIGLLPLLIVFVFVNLVLHFTYCPLYPSARNAILQDWEKETAQHDLLREGWRHDERDHANTIDKWKRETEWHEKDVARRIQEEDERQERVRWEWGQEHERHLREIEEYEEAVAHRVREERERQERVKEEWDQEVQEHHAEVARRTLEEEERQKMVRREWDQEARNHRHECEEMERRENEHRENERQKWKREIEDHDQIEEERRKREEEERQKLNMFWGHVESHACTTYATREYTAQLMNLPASWEHRVEACKATPLEVHGVSYFPTSCEDKGPGVVIGRWGVDQHEPDCATFWNWYKDKGCTSLGSGKRRIEHYLENLPQGGDWREFCATTPAHFHGMEFLGAQECFQYKLGTYGHWELDDISCY